MPDLIVGGKGECKLNSWQKISASVTRLHDVLVEKLGGDVKGVFFPFVFLTVLPTHKSHHHTPTTRLYSLSSPITRAPFAHPSPSPPAPLSPPSSISPPIQFSPHSFLSPPQSDVLLSSVSTLSPLVHLLSPLRRCLIAKFKLSVVTRANK